MTEPDGLEKCVWKYMAEMMPLEQAMDYNHEFAKCYTCDGKKENHCYYPLSKFLDFEILKRLRNG